VYVPPGFASENRSSRTLSGSALPYIVRTLARILIDRSDSSRLSGGDLRRQILVILQTALAQAVPHRSSLVFLRTRVFRSTVSMEKPWIDRIESRAELVDHHLLPAARPDLLRRAGRPADARTAYQQALALAANASQRAYLIRRLAEVTSA